MIQDGGFEDGTPNAAWDEDSTNSGTPICSLQRCAGIDSDIGPYTGTFWVLFGGTQVYELGSVSQAVRIPSGTAIVSFWLAIPQSSGSGEDMLRVSIDGKTIFEVTDANAGGYQKYNQVIRDVSTYADGGIHTLEIFAEVNGNHQSTTSFFVDDVVLILTGNTTPTPSAEPTSTGQPSSLQPTAGPESTNQPALTLYFAPSNGSLLIPVTRSVSSPSDLNPETALAELFRGPQPGSGLVRLIPSDVTVLSLQQQNSNVTVNLDQQIDNDLALRSIAHTLTALPGVNSVQFQVDGVDVGLQGNDRPLLRPQLNPDNPEQLSGEFGSRTRFLPLYFVYDDYRVRITRFIPHTLDIATRTVEELFAGPGSYADRLQTVIPPQTRLRSIRSDGDLVIVDINEAFVNATDRQAALGTLVLSLTDLQNERQQPFFRRVEVRIEGKALADFWGEDYDRQFTRPMLNQEYTTP